MLQEFLTPTLREASPCVLETERLSLRRPTLADVKAIARLANDRRIAENTRRLPHPYLHEHAVEFVRTTAAEHRSLHPTHSVAGLGPARISVRSFHVPHFEGRKGGHSAYLSQRWPSGWSAPLGEDKDQAAVLTVFRMF